MYLTVLRLKVAVCVAVPNSQRQCLRRQRTGFDPRLSRVCLGVLSLSEDAENSGQAPSYLIVPWLPAISLCNIRASHIAEIGVILPHTQIFHEMKLRSHFLHSCTGSVSDLYIPTIGPHILLQKIGGPIRGST